MADSVEQGFADTSGVGCLYQQRKNFNKNIYIVQVETSLVLTGTAKDVDLERSRKAMGRGRLPLLTNLNHVD